MLSSEISLTIDTPLLIINFNRPDQSKELLEILRKFKPKKIYYAVDGARSLKAGELEKVKQVQEMIQEIDWECELHLKFNDLNLGGKWGPISAINWIFEHEEKAIILEDDVRPNESFFKFCDQMLEKYKNNQEVFFIGGSNSLNDRPRTESYRFSSLLYVWGWATWRHAWQLYEPNINNWKREVGIRGLKKHFECSWIEALLIGYIVLDGVAKNRIQAWGYQLTYLAIKSKKLGLISNTNLTENVGFGRDSTHTRIKPDFLLKKENITFPLIHPEIKRDVVGDQWIIRNAFGLVSYKKYLLNVLKLILIKLQAKIRFQKLNNL